MSSYNAPTDGSTDNGPTASVKPGDPEPLESSPARVGTIVWGLIVLALAALIIVARLGLVALDGSYVLIGLMLGAGAALVVGGLISARGRDKDSSTGKS
ncbi:hypothetical protein QFZ79_002224 [Arthrobacter sp. V4I6]|uniref:hypothetical protein n=1 Tax=unclassified Arthrobacter TaxID=235627 RepID=UPI002787A11C|nr:MULTISPECIES: hypothetical protein [unclassified Arthrobacter]MDQ0819931.1 hypothetical protein [Arthrobacter sp. V1I7]MDQ0854113.1 hypothetical protein [Arthrobacter sp. V4I6]